MNLDSINHGHIQDLEEPESKSCSFSSFLFTFWLYLIHIIIFVWYVLASTSLHFFENVHPLICLLLLCFCTHHFLKMVMAMTLYERVSPPPPDTFHFKNEAFSKQSYNTWLHFRNKVWHLHLHAVWWCFQEFKNGW